MIVNIVYFRHIYPQKNRVKNENNIKLYSIILFL